MELFVKVFFWLNIVGVTINLLVLGLLEFPRERTRMDVVVGVFLEIIVAVWAGILLFK